MIDFGPLLKSVLLLFGAAAQFGESFSLLSLYWGDISDAASDWYYWATDGPTSIL